MLRTLSSLISILLGGFLYLLFSWLWNYIAMLSPIPSMLIKAGLSGNSFLLLSTLADFILYVIFFLPSAWVLWRLGPTRILANTFLATSSFAATYAILNGLPVFSYGSTAAIGYILLLASIPAAVWIMSWFVGGASNNSFKPTPLRGAA